MRFYWRASPAVLPVWWNGRLQVLRWGNRDRAEEKLPVAGLTWEQRVASGWWAQLAPEEVVVPAALVMANGVWFKVKQGLEALLVHDRRGEPVVFLVVRAPTRYYEIMCRTDWMPAFVGEVI